MMFHYQRNLIAKNLFPEDMNTCRFTSTTRKDHISFSSHPGTMAFLITTGDVTSTPPPNSGLDEKFKVSYSPAESFKKSIKRDANIFIAFKEGKNWDALRRNTLATSRAQDIAEVINPDYLPVT